MITYTNSSIATYASCPRRYEYAYVYRIRRETISPALVVGRRFDSTVKHWHRTGEMSMPLPEDGDHAKAIALSRAYAYVWQDRHSDVQYDVRFRRRLPGTHLWVAGEADGVLGSSKLWELKTTSEDIDPGSDYWLKLRLDWQISLYCWALGLNHVMYDVAKKPTIRQKKEESLEEYRNRCIEQLTSEPDRFFARKEVVRLDRELQQFLDTDLIPRIVLIRATKQFPRHIAWDSCRWCEYQSPCYQDIPASPPPIGYQLKTYRHEELGHD